MSRAWPFEEKSGAPAVIRTPEDFIKAVGLEGSEAVVIRIGLNDTQLVLVGPNGRWERWVYHSEDEATQVGKSLGIPIHVGEYPEETRVRIGKYVPEPGHFEKHAYPEQGEVGPVIPYPENRPRQIQEPAKTSED
jgi:antitoxin component of MazEF toxin-antitoxin module